MFTIAGSTAAAGRILRFCHGSHQHRSRIPNVDRRAPTDAAHDTEWEPVGSRAVFCLSFTSLSQASSFSSSLNSSAWVVSLGLIVSGDACRSSEDVRALRALRRRHRH